MPLANINLWALLLIVTTTWGGCWRSDCCSTLSNFRFSCNIILNGLTINMIICNCTLHPNHRSIIHLLFGCAYYSKYWCKKNNLFLYIQTEWKFEKKKRLVLMLKLINLFYQYHFMVSILTITKIAKNSGAWLNHLIKNQQNSIHGSEI